MYKFPDCPLSGALIWCPAINFLITLLDTFLITPLDHPLPNDLIINGVCSILFNRLIEGDIFKTIIPLRRMELRVINPKMRWPEIRIRLGEKLGEKLGERHDQISTNHLPSFALFLRLRLGARCLIRSPASWK